MPTPNEPPNLRRVPPLSPPPVEPSSRLTTAEFSRRSAIAILIAILLLGLTALLWTGIHYLLMAFAGLLFAVFLTALANWVTQHTHLAHGWSLTLVIVVLILIACGLGWLLESRLALQTQEMMKELPQSVERIQHWLDQYKWGQKVTQAGAEAAGNLTGGFSTVMSVVGGVLNFIVAVIVIIFVGIFGAAEPRLYRAGFLHLIPAPHRPRTEEAIDAVIFNLRWWLLGQIFLMIVIGITSALGLWLMGIPLALTLGLIAGILEMIPYAGPWISAAPALLVALLISPWHVIGVAGLYLFLHLLEGYVLLPLVQRQTVLLPPAFTLIMQVLLGELLGFMGLFVAAPLTVAGVVILKMLYVEDTLGDENVDVPGEARNEQKPEARERRQGRAS
jgi:predicted PurR-regulated permease PerM